MLSIYTPMKNTLLLSLLIILLLANLPQAVLAQDSAPLGIVSTTTPAGVQLEWSAPAVSAASVESARTLLPVARHHGYDLPIHSFSLLLPSDMTPTVQIEQLSSMPLAGTIMPAAAAAPPVLDWTPMPNIQPTEKAYLPSAPAFILREGTVKGQRLAVLVISPIYEEAGVVKLATSLKVNVPGARLTSTGPGDIVAAAAQFAPTQAEVVDVPVNQAALKDGFKIVVSQPGLQEVLFSTLGANFDAGKVNLTYRGESVAVEVLADRFRFYVPEVGDRWNMTSVYWLTTDTAGARMADGTNTGDASPAGQAYERGVWRENKIYSSEYPGSDGDHWFNTSLSVGGAMTQSFPSAVTPLTNVLPGAAGESTYTTAVTVVGSVPSNECSSTDSAYKVQLDLLNNQTALDTQVTEWNPSLLVNGVCRIQDDWNLAWTTGDQPTSLKLTLLPSGVAGYNTSILLDAIEWERPVTLNFGGGSAEFWTQPGAWRFTLSGLPVARTLYDVTDALNPVKIPLAAGAQAVFGQAESATPRRYLLARLDAHATPQVNAHRTVAFGNVLEKDAIYIGPAQWSDELQPLLTLRTAQGHKPLFVDVQAIFDVYGYGHISAPAIRNFLRHRSDWQNGNRTISVVLVGDGTYDPFNYRNTSFPSNALHPVPPYMLDVDIYINEVPCETCFAQLNGDDPVTGDDPDARDPKSNFFSPDVWLGRFPVRTEAELTGLVNKIVAYEQAAAGDGWGSTQVLLADNYILSIDAENLVTLDTAGDFANYSDEVAAIAGYGADVKRIYYDHSADRKVVFASNSVSGRYATIERVPPEPWRIASIPEVRQMTFDALNTGAGLVFYNGHSNHWNYAKLEDRSGAAALPLLSIVEANILSNRDKPFIGLSMTCLTSQFAIPAVSGTLDELFVRNPNGGAVATWGPTGQSVAHGHDYLQRGFTNKLRTSPPNSLRMGELVEAGYDSLLYSPLTGSLDALKTFAVLGDPLTRARLNAGFDNGLFLPTVQR